LALAGLAYAAWSNRRLFTVSDVTSGESGDYPHLISHVYYAPIQTVLAAAEQSVRMQSGWRVVLVDEDRGVIEAEVESGFARAIDDLTVRCFDIGHSQTRVIIRSRSRMARGDLGANAQHILQLQQAMDIRLTANAAF
jgi:uncharacterized protein (DUF1499 family)